jgi:hypothetical protein
MANNLEHSQGKKMASPPESRNIMPAVNIPDVMRAGISDFWMMNDTRAEWSQ